GANVVEVWEIVMAAGSGRQSLARYRARTVPDRTARHSAGRLPISCGATGKSGVCARQNLPHRSPVRAGAVGNPGSAAYEGTASFRGPRPIAAPAWNSVAVSR